MKNKAEIMKMIRENRNLDSEMEHMSLAELRRLHKILFEEAIRVGRAEFGDNFDVAAMRRKIDNTFEHMHENMCSLPINFCNRNSCDYYDMDCITRKIKDQIDRIVLEILNTTGDVTHTKDPEGKYTLETMLEERTGKPEWQTPQSSSDVISA